MAAFCVSCGNPLADGAKFCTKCGATQPAAAAPVGTVMPPAPGCSGFQRQQHGMKILIGVLAFFMFLILVVAGSCAYIAYRVKQKTHEFSESMHTNAKPYTGKRQPCAMLTTSEAVGCPGPDCRVGGAARHHGLRVFLRLMGSISTWSTPGKMAASPWGLLTAP